MSCNDVARTSIRHSGARTAFGLALLAGTALTGSARASIVYSWGYNPYGQLGNGTDNNSQMSPAPVTGMTNASAIGAGTNANYFVQNGALYSSGNNSYGQLGTGSNTPTSTPVASPTLSSGVTAVAGGYRHGLAIQNGAVYGFGDDSYGQLGDNTTTYGTSSTPVAAVGLSSGATQVAANYKSSMALVRGAVYTWGYGYNGELGDGAYDYTPVPTAIASLSSGVTKIAMGYASGAAIKGGALYTWGSNRYGDLGDGGAQQYVSTPELNPTLTSGVTDVAMGADGGLAVVNGHVYAFGYNGYGQLGDGTYNNSATPEEIDPADLNNIVAVASAGYSSYALAADGTIWDWGYAYDGELGLGSAVDDYETTPQHLFAPAGYVFSSISANNNAYGAVATLSPTSVPEPGCLSILSIGTLALARRRRR